jgi:hypothetical protein
VSVWTTSICMAEQKAAEEVEEVTTEPAVVNVAHLMAYVDEQREEGNAAFRKKRHTEALAAWQRALDACEQADGKPMLVADVETVLRVRSVLHSNRGQALIEQEWWRRAVKELSEVSAVPPSCCCSSLQLLLLLLVPRLACVRTARFIIHNSSHTRVPAHRRCRSTRAMPRPCGGGALERVEMAAALGSGSASLPSLPQPRPRMLPFLLGSGPSPFEATGLPSKGGLEAEDLRPDPKPDPDPNPNPNPDPNPKPNQVSLPPPSGRPRVGPCGGQGLVGGGAGRPRG